MRSEWHYYTIKSELYLIPETRTTSHREESSASRTNITFGEDNLDIKE